MHAGALAYKDRIEQFIPGEARRAYYAPSAVHSMLTFAHIWAALSASFGIIALLQRGPLAIQLVFVPFLICLIGTRINALAVQVHEASHGLLMKNRRLNNWFCNLAGAYWVLNDVASYWRMHREHHAHLHEPLDPDRDLYGIPGNDRRSLAKVLLQDALWVTALTRIARYSRRPGTKFGPAQLGHGLGKVAAQSAVLAAFVGAFGLTHGPVLFVIYWLIPLFSVFPVLIRVRIVTEHYAEQFGNSNMQVFVSRTSISNALEEYLIGANMEFHLEHHLFPRIPYHQLKQFHRELVLRGYFNELNNNETVLSGGYVRYWRALLFRNRSLKSTRTRAA